MPRQIILKSLAELGQSYHARADRPKTTTPDREPTAADRSTVAAEPTSPAESTTDEQDTSRAGSTTAEVASEAWSTTVEGAGSEAGAHTADPDVADASGGSGVDRETAAVEAILAVLKAQEDALVQIQSDDVAARETHRVLLERYDALAAAAAKAKRALTAAQSLRIQARTVVAEAFAGETRVGAGGVADRAAAAETQVARALETLRDRARRFAAEHGLEQAIEERRRRDIERATKARDAGLARARRLNEVLAAARKALAANNLKEARELLGTADNENPGSREIPSLLAIITQRELESKVTLAEDALCLSRHERQYGRFEPRAVAARMAALDVVGLSRLLAWGVFVCWTDACTRLCERERYVEPLLYRPGRIDRGAIVARREPGGPYEVVSAVGLPDFPPPGSPVPDDVTRRALPLT